MTLLYAFMTGGLICLIAQILMDKFKLLPVHLVVLFVFLGACFEMFGLYDKLVEIAGAGALIPISSFGHTLTHAAVEGAKNFGYMGIFSEVLTTTSVGISITIVFAFLVAIAFRPRG